MTLPSYPAHPARLIVVALVAFGVAAAGAKGQGNSSRPAKVLPQRTTTATNTSSTSASANTNSAYIIGPGDLLAINVLHEPEVSQKVPVRMDGKISMPLIGEIQAMPEKPSFPNCQLFTLGGLWAGLALGVGIVHLSQAPDKSIRTRAGRRDLHGSANTSGDFPYGECQEDSKLG